MSKFSKYLEDIKDFRNMESLMKKQEPPDLIIPILGDKKEDDGSPVIEGRITIQNDDGFRVKVSLHGEDHMLITNQSFYFLYRAMKELFGDA
jgi:hypothetical protein